MKIISNKLNTILKTYPGKVDILVYFDSLSPLGAFDVDLDIS